MVLSNLILKSTEKEDIGFVKIKSIEVEDLHEILSKHDIESVCREELYKPQLYVGQQQPHN